jgi:hypothetical protein
MLKYREERPFVSLRGGLGGPPSFVACWSISVVVIELWAEEAFVLRLLLLVFVTFLCKHFMFFIYIVYVYSGSFSMGVKLGL